MQSALLTQAGKPDHTIDRVHLTQLAPTTVPEQNALGDAEFLWPITSLKTAPPLIPYTVLETRNRLV